MVPFATTETVAKMVQTTLENENNLTTFALERSKLLSELATMENNSGGTQGRKRVKTREGMKRMLDAETRLGVVQQEMSKLKRMLKQQYIDQGIVK